MDKCWIPGLPTTFATKGESPWKNDLKNALFELDVSELVIGITLKFVLPTINCPAQCPDIDNLCEPVFSVIVNNLGWFGGKRTNIKWWNASKTYGEQTGLEIVLHQENPPSSRERCGNPCSGLVGPDNYYETTTPQKSPRILKPENRFIIRIEAIIDCLFPFIGGSRGRPEDWRVKELHVEKGAPDVKDGPWN